MGFVALQGGRLGFGKYTKLFRLLAAIGIVALGFHGWRLASPDRLWAGLTERVLIGLFLLWVLVLAKALVKHSKQIEQG